MNRVLIVRSFSVAVLLVVAYIVGIGFALPAASIVVTAAIWLTTQNLRVKGAKALTRPAIGILICLIAPGPSDIRSYTYTKNLFTVQELAQVKFGTADPFLTKDESRFHRWRRVHLGFPTNATTIDVSLEGHGFLAVIEPLPVTFNALFGFVAVTFLHWAMTLLFAFGHRNKRSSL